MTSYGIEPEKVLRGLLDWVWDFFTIIIKLHTLFFWWIKYQTFQWFNFLSDFRSFTFPAFLPSDILLNFDLLKWGLPWILLLNFDLFLLKNALFQLTSFELAARTLTFGLERISTSFHYRSMNRWPKAPKNHLQSHPYLDPRKSRILPKVHPSFNPYSLKNKIQLKDHVHLYDTNQLPAEKLSVFWLENPVWKKCEV